MVDIDRFAAILEEQAALLPKEVLKNLNLGIGVSEKAKRDRRARPGLALYIRRIPCPPCDGPRRRALLRLVSAGASGADG